MSTLDLVLRAMAGTQLAFLALLLLVRSRNDRALGYAGMLPCGLAVFMITSAPMPAGSLGAWTLPLTLVCVANPAWFWMFARAWFDDGFRPGWREGSTLASMLVLGGAHELAYAPGEAPALVDALFKAAILGCFVAAAAKVLADRPSDLVEGRRRGRALFVVAVAVYAAVAILLQVAFDGRLPAAMVRVNVAFLFAAALTLSMVVSLAAPLPLRDERPALRTRRVPAVADERLLARIRDAMESQRLYRDEALTVARLAQAVGSQEYRVRRAINGGLGYRNFNDFLHRYRLGEAEARLRAQPQLPILTIALDVGYGSIGPFNRAFRRRHGCTPSEYRAGSETGHVLPEIGEPSTRS